VPVKTAEQQATALLHRGREQLVRQRTMLVNALRAHLAEFGMVAAQGLRNVGELIAIVRDIVSSSPTATRMNFPSLVNSMPRGLWPTLIVFTTVNLSVSTTLMVLLFSFDT